MRQQIKPITPRPLYKGLYILAEWAFDKIYGTDEQRDIAQLVEIVAPPQTAVSLAANPGLLAEVEVILSGWGGPVLDAAFLQAAPRLQAFFYGAGATGGLICPETWERNIHVTSAAAANAVPVAEFTLASIIYALKRALPLSRRMHTAGEYVRPVQPAAGGYGSTVGLVSLGAIGRLVAKQLSAVLHDVTIVAYDPFVSAEEASRLGVELVGLDTVFAQADVVSLHTPWLPETTGMIRGQHLCLMKPGATLINTARGAIIAEPEMVDVLATRPDLTAILDVTDPEPPPPNSPLFRLENVFLTPHISGSQDEECRRMGRYMVEELRRYCLGEPLQGAIHPHSAEHTVHRSRISC